MTPAKAASRAAARAALHAAAALCFFAAASVQAQTAAVEQPTALTGTLDKVQRSGIVTIGYRESSIPFSFLSPTHEPIGYSVQLCTRLVEAIGTAVDKTLAIKWVPVTSATRFDAVVNGDIDLECGSTTNNLERQKRVAFSPTFFVAGTKLLVKKGSSITSFRDLKGKRIAVTDGTTNEKAIRDLSTRFDLGYDVIVSKDHADSFALVVAGKADAFATDDVLLYGEIADSKARGDAGYQVVGEFLSYDPYGVMYRRNDPKFAAVVNDAFHDMAEDGEIQRQYKRWFLTKLPSGTSLDLPMSPQLVTLIEAMGTKPD